MHFLHLGCISVISSSRKHRRTLPHLYPIIHTWKVCRNVHMQLIYTKVLNGHKQKVKSVLFKVQMGEKEEVDR